MWAMAARGDEKRWTVLASLLFCVGVAGGCSLRPATACWQNEACRPPATLSQDEAAPLALEEWRRDSLHCRAGNCQDWYSVDVSRRSRVRLRVFSPEEPDQPGFDVVLLDATTREIARVGRVEHGPREITTRLAPGRYWLGLLAYGTHDARISYEVVANELSHGDDRTQLGDSRAASPGPAKLGQRAARESIPIESAVLDVSPNQRGLFLAAGRSAGLREGLRGDLLLDGDARTIRVEISEVFESGSRAHIVEAIDDPSVVIDPLKARVLIQPPARD